MNKAYIILAHKQPEQLMRLINSLDDNHSTFFVHLDKKVNVSQFKALQQHRSKVIAVPNVHTKWGGFGLVKATLNGMKAVKDYPKQFDFISLISGQHYPIKSNEHISDFLRTTRHRVFLEYSHIPNYHRWKVRGGLYRIDKYFLGLRGYERYGAKALNFISSRLHLLKREFPQTMKPYAGSQWWTMDNDTLTYVLNFVENNAAYTAYHQHTFAPDELFFHNILLNAEDDTLRSGIVNNNLLYVNWPNLDDGHPEILLRSDMDNIASSRALFARKFDIEHDAEILDMIDENRA